MTNDEKRREVAKRIRELPADVYNVTMEWHDEGIDTNCQDQTDYYQLHNVVMGCLPAENMHPCDYEEFHGLLADLIDPTCEYVPIGDERFGCSECGNTARLDYDVPVTDETTMPFKHCPNCGARVVRSND